MPPELARTTQREPGGRKRHANRAIRSKTCAASPARRGVTGHAIGVRRFWRRLPVSRLRRTRLASGTRSTRLQRCRTSTGANVGSGRRRAGPAPRRDAGRRRPGCTGTLHGFDVKKNTFQTSSKELKLQQ